MVNQYLSKVLTDVSPPSDKCLTDILTPPDGCFSPLTAVVSARSDRMLKYETVGEHGTISLKLCHIQGTSVSNCAIFRDRR